MEEGLLMTRQQRLPCCQPAALIVLPAAVPELRLCCRCQHGCLAVAAKHHPQMMALQQQQQQLQQQLCAR
jgi:hypothetical protein